MAASEEILRNIRAEGIILVSYKKACGQYVNAHVSFTSYKSW